MLTKEMLLEAAEIAEKYPAFIPFGYWGQTDEFNDDGDEVKEYVTKHPEALPLCCPGMYLAVKYDLDPEEVLTEIDNNSSMLDPHIGNTFTGKLVNNPQKCAQILRELANDY